MQSHVLDESHWHNGSSFQQVGSHWNTNTKWGESNGPSHKLARQLPKCDHHNGNPLTNGLDMGCSEHKAIEWKTYEEGKGKTHQGKEVFTLMTKRSSSRHTKDWKKDICNYCKEQGHWAKDWGKKRNKRHKQKKNKKTMQTMEEHLF